MEVTFIQKVLQIKLRWSPCTEVFITQREYYYKAKLQAFVQLCHLPNALIQGLSMENAKIAITKAVEGEHLNFQLTISFHTYLHHNKAFWDFFNG